MATRAEPLPEKLNDEIRFRAPTGLRARLKAIARTKRTKYQFEAREALIRFVEEWESAVKK